jgi:hypothetical protein
MTSDRAVAYVVHLLSQVWQGAGSAPLWPAMLSAARWEAEKEAGRLRTLVETHAFALGELQLADLVVLQQLVALAFVGQRGYCGPPIVLSSSHLRAPISEIGAPISEIGAPISEIGPPISEIGPPIVLSSSADGATQPDSPPSLERAWGGRRAIELGSTAHVDAAIEARRALTNRAIDVVPRHLALCPRPACTCSPRRSHFPTGAPPPHPLPRAELAAGRWRRELGVAERVGRVGAVDG